MTTQTTLEEARAMADRNEPLPEEFYMDMEGEVQFKRQPQTTTQSCRTCKFLDRGDAKRIQAFLSYPCLAPIPEMPKMPDSVTKAYGFKWPVERTKSFTCPSYGLTCPAYEKVKK